MLTVLSYFLNDRLSGIYEINVLGYIIGKLTEDTHQNEIDEKISVEKIYGYSDFLGGAVKVGVMVRQRGKWE